jgi:hypothetical protein
MLSIARLLTPAIYGKVGEFLCSRGKLAGSRRLCLTEGDFIFEGLERQLVLSRAASQHHT